jgi:DNA primase
MESPLEAAWLEFGGDPIPPHHGWVKVRCVLHSERRPSATVNLETGKFSCFAGCGHGDVYDLIGLHESLTDFKDQKAFAEERGWVLEEEPPEPSPMNPNPRGRVKSKPKKAWKPSWLT